MSTFAATIFQIAILLQTQSAPAAEAVRPETLVVTAGDIRTRVEAAKMWTISGLDYRSAMFATEDSAYGSVLTIRGVGHLGTAHFLDVPGGTGELEKEDVRELRLFVDDKPVAGAGKMEATGKTFRMERISSIRAMQLDSSVDIRNNIIVETVRYQTKESIDLQTMHHLMYAWTPKADQFVYGKGGNVIKRGKLLPDGAEVSRVVEKQADWVAVFDEQRGVGAVLLITRKPSDADAWFLLVDAPGVYRKTAVQSFAESIVPAGFDGVCQAAVGFFEADDRNFETAAVKRARELKAHAQRVSRK